MQTKAGTYIRFGKKEWICADCGKIITTNFKHFVRISIDTKVSEDCYGEPYYKVLYKRWHIECALALNDLNDYEKTLLGPHLLALHEAQDAQEDVKIRQIASESVLKQNR